MIGLADSHRSSLLQACRDAAWSGSRIKAASLGGDPDTSFEQTFAALAFEHVKEKAPRLLDYLKGFQLLDRSNDNEKAAGIFGFQLGRRWLYAPVFFINGDLKGHELLYLKGQDQFVPLKENWVNKLLAQRPHVLGEETSESARQLGILHPDVRKLSQLPKYGSVEDRPGWYQDFLPVLGDWATRSPRRMAKYAGLEDRFSVPVVCRQSLACTQLVKQACDTYPELGRLCRQFYGPAFLVDALRSLRKQALVEERRRERGPSLVRPETKLAAGPPVEVRVLTDQMLTEHDTDLSDEDRQRLLRDGYLVRDARSGEEVSRAYNVQLDAALANPDASGFYDVLVKPGTFERLLVLCHPTTSRGRRDFVTVLEPGNPRRWLNAQRTSIWVKSQASRQEDQQKGYEQLSGTSPGELHEHGVYLVVSRGEGGALDGSLPFEVRRELGENRYEVSWLDYSVFGRPLHLPAAAPIGCVPAYDDALYGGKDLVFCSDRAGVKFRSIGGTLMVPQESKLLKLDEPKRNEDGFIEPCCSAQSEEPPIEPGDYADLQLQVSQKTAEFKIHADGTEVSLNAGPLQSKLAALVELVRGYGFREETARELLKQAETEYRRGNPFLARVKYAQGYPMLGAGPVAPSIQDPPYGYDAGPMGMTTQYPQEELQPVPELASGLTDPSVYDTRPEMMDPAGLQAAQSAGQAGQREVFDAAMLGTLLKSMRQDSLVSRFLGDLLKALDRLGRILFLFYWHNAEFMDRYGKSDMPELEDSLRNAFEILGDLVLFLQEKDVAPLPGIDMGSPDIQDAAGE